MIWNILPVDDLEEHIDNSTCNCHPEVQLLENGDIICIHNAYDGRERKEELIDEIFKNFEYS